MLIRVIHNSTTQPSIPDPPPSPPRMGTTDSASLTIWKPVRQVTQGPRTSQTWVPPGIELLWDLSCKSPSRRSPHIYGSQCTLQRTAPDFWAALCLITTCILFWFPSFLLPCYVIGLCFIVSWLFSLFQFSPLICVSNWALMFVFFPLQSIHPVFLPASTKPLFFVRATLFYFASSPVLF